MRKKNLVMSCCFSQQVKISYPSQDDVYISFYSAANSCVFTMALTSVRKRWLNSRSDFGGLSALASLSGFGKDI